MPKCLCKRAESTQNFYEGDWILQFSVNFTERRNEVGKLNKKKINLEI